MAFPDTGAYKTHSGMFLGETHDETETMLLLTKQLRLLSTKVDVIFLEMYPEGESPRLKFPQTIAPDLVRFNKHFNKAQELAQNIYRLWSMAYYFGIDIEGMEQDLPGQEQPKGLLYLAHRMDKGFNQGFLDCVDRYAARTHKPSVRFCLYMGLTHWIPIKKLATQIPGYRVLAGTFVGLPR